MIKVLQPISNPYKLPNPFVYALIDGIEDLYDDIHWGWGTERFWTDRVFDYDIILIQWPDSLLYSNNGVTHSVEDIKYRIELVKNKGVKIISFVHNLVPHYSADKTQYDCYNIVYSSADVLLHMGEYSKNMLSGKYNQAKHISLGPHYLYDKIYRNNYSREQGCCILGLDPNYKYVLAFGAFRDDEERALVKELSNDLKDYDKNIMILAPSFTKIPEKKCKFDIRPRLYKYRLKHKDHIICNGGTFNTVSDNLLPYYYAASDVCLIHRKRILNSGNVPMAFLMKKVVAGPDEGNVGEVLRNMENPVFDVNDRKSIVDSVITAFEMSKNGKGLRNYENAMNNFSTEMFSNKLHDALLESLN